MIQKIIIFDASTLITLVMNGLTEELRSLKKIFNGKFIITNEVKYEIVDKNNKFGLHAYWYINNSLTLFSKEL